MASNPYKKAGETIKKGAKGALYGARLATWPIQGEDFINKEVRSRTLKTKLKTPHGKKAGHAVGKKARKLNPAARAAQAQRKNMNAADVSMNNSKYNQ